MPITEEDARERIEEERSFYVHLATFMLIMPLLIVLNVFTSTSHFWFVYPLLGWLMGLGGHAASVFGVPGKGSSWEERRLAQLTGGDTEEAAADRLRRLLDDELESRGATEAPHPARLLQRIEHLEAIVTSTDWDEATRARLSLDDETKDETDEERAARLARRIR